MREEFAMLLFFFGISVTANVALAIAAFRSMRRVRRLEDRQFAAAPVAAENDRLERLEGVVDALDDKLVQLGRGQEFLSKLVSERRRALGAAERQVTPH